jgi:hypothetical protein
VQASADSFPDLWLALKGGSNNFGIVTAFDLMAIEQSDFWGGAVGFGVDTIAAQFSAFEALTGQPNYDPFAALIQSFGWDVTSRSWGASSSMVYTKLKPDPAVFINFTSLPSNFSTLRVSNLADFANELSIYTPPGRRQLMVTGTYRNSAEMMKKIFDIANDTVQDLDEVEGVRVGLSFQPQPLVLLEKAERVGGNSLGLDASKGPLFNFLLNIAWDSTSADGHVNRKAQELHTRAEKEAVELGVEHRYLYLNYAAPWQDPIAGYGSEIRKRLQLASTKYDPVGVFQEQVPGGFKVFPQDYWSRISATSDQTISE